MSVFHATSPVPINRIRIRIRIPFLPIQTLYDMTCLPHFEKIGGFYSENVCVYHKTLQKEKYEH